MDFKLDENLGRRWQQQLAAAGHAVSTVAEQDLSGSPDHVIGDVCRLEQRCLVTLDLDFANPLQFAPAEHAGIVVLRPPPKTTPTDLDHLIDVLSQALETRSVTGRLWIVQPGRIREYQSPDD
jgi:predicted nuclease of predicted toxin-antitoxin system